MAEIPVRSGEGTGRQTDLYFTVSESLGVEKCIFLKVLPPGSAVKLHLLLENSPLKRMMFHSCHFCSGFQLLVSTVSTEWIFFNFSF